MNQMNQMNQTNRTNQMKQISFVLAALILSGLLAYPAQAQGPRPAQQGCTAEVGQTMPPVELESLLQAPEGASATPEDLAGKVIVYEFWATWCGPCVGAIPHLNEMADHFADQDVQFIAISPERLDVVETFLADNEMRAWIGVDTNSSVSRDHGITSIPRTIIVGRDGKIAAVTRPSLLTQDHVQAILDGQTPQIPDRLSPIVPGGDPLHDEEEAVTTRIILRPAACKNRLRCRFFDTRDASTASAATILNFSAREIIALAYGRDASYTVDEADLPEGTWDLIAAVPTENPGAFRGLLDATLKATFDVEVSIQTREVPVFELVLADDASQPDKDAAQGNNRGRMMSADQLAKRLELKFGRPMFNLTGMETMDPSLLPWKMSTAAQVTQAFSENMGVEVRESVRELEVLVIEPAQ